MFLIGDKVSIIGGVYRDEQGTIVRMTKHMCYIKLRDRKKIRIMQYNVASYLQSTSIWIQHLNDELKHINKQVENVTHLIKAAKQDNIIKFSLLTLLFLSIFVIILSNFDFKIIRLIKFGINEVVYRSSYLISLPENKIQNIKKQLTAHLEIYSNYQDIKSELNILKEEKLINDFLKLENEKLRNLIDENVSSEEILAKVLIDKESPFLKSIVLNKGSKDNVKIGMAIMDGVYLAGKVIEVNYTNSRALLLSDLNSKIPVLLEPVDIHAVVSGTGSNHGVIEYTKDDYDQKTKNKCYGLTPPKIGLSCSNDLFSLPRES